MREQISIAEVISYLNGLNAIDSDALRRMLLDRVSTNREMLDHPTLPVRAYRGRYSFGFLAVLNGLFGFADGTYPIAANFEVICPNGHDNGDHVAGEQCPTCGHKLVLGKLLGFLRSPATMTVPAKDPDVLHLNNGSTIKAPNARERMKALERDPREH